MSPEPTFKQKGLNGAGGLLPTFCIGMSLTREGKMGETDPTEKCKGRLPLKGPCLHFRVEQGSGTNSLSRHRNHANGREEGLALFGPMLVPRTKLTPENKVCLLPFYVAVFEGV